MVRTNLVNLKNAVIDLRKQGFSFSEIQAQIPIAKSTLSSWLADLKLSPEQMVKLKAKRLESIKIAAGKKIAKTQKIIAAVRDSSAKDIGKISKRELWLLGVVLYWRERLLNHNESDLKKGVRFSSSDPLLVNLFLKWLHDVGGLTENEIDFDIFVTSSQKPEGGQLTPAVKKIVNFWAVNTGFNPSYFTHIYYQKRRPTKGKRKIVNKSEMGILRIRVKASSMLARQINGWIEGIKQTLLN